jgi:hypothetical protein
MEKEQVVSKKLITKTVARTLTYQSLALFTFLSVIFIMQPRYWGNRAPVIERSVNHIFYPVEYSESVEEYLLDIGRKRLFYEFVTDNGSLPELFEIIKDSEYIEGEEWYHCEYQYVDKNGVLDIHKYRTRIKWKPWELYFPSPKDEEKIQEKVDNLPTKE